MEKITVGLLLTSVILVAAFNLISMLTMSVTEKRGDIAILQVLGLPSRKLLMLFLGHGLLLALLGISLGAVAGVLLATHISDLSLWAEQAFGLVLFDPAVYYIGGLPSRLQWQDVIAVASVALLLSLLASVYPAWRASGCRLQRRSTMSDHAVLKATGLGKRYRDVRREIAVLNDLTLSVAPGEWLAIVGASGAGKSTLLNLLGGLDAASEG